MPRRSFRAAVASLIAVGALATGPLAAGTAATAATAATATAAAMHVATTADAARTSASPPVTGLHVGVDDFTFASFDAVYELDRDEAKRSVLDTTETLVAIFPEFDQNRGIRRAIPLRYDGHPVDISVESVTDASGVPRPFEVERDEDGEFLLVTVRADDFVHGEQSYVIRYRQHNVTLEPDDAEIDEFYWDVNGTGWAQPFGRVTAELRMSPEVASGLTGELACYRGWAGAGTPCDAIGTDGGTPPVVRAEARGLGPYENLTIAVGFTADTFEPRDESFAASWAAIAGAAAAAFAVLAAALAIAFRVARWRNHPGRGTIIAQYEPPPGVSAMVAADLVGRADRGITATILERAVAGELRIVETGRKRYAVDFVGGEAGDADARSIVLALYRGSPVPGARRALKSRDTSLGRRLLALRQAVRKRVVQARLRRRPELGTRVLLAIGAIAAAALSLVFGIFALEDHRGGAWPALIFVAAIVAAIVTLVVVADVRPLTAAGRDVRDHLEGLRLYIRLAEADRLRVLQSPSGAMRVDRPAASVGGAGVPVGAAHTGADAGAASLDPDVVLKLNERLLPYAVLFGLEREWADELASLYEARDRTPEWYSGRSGFNAGAFSVAVASFSSASSTSWSGSSSSSSSSGSGGGGSSGGGGGGGGGGGV